MARYDDGSLKAILKEWDGVFQLFDESSAHDLFSRLAVAVDWMKRIRSVFTAKNNNPALILILMKKITLVSPPILMKLDTMSTDGMGLKERCCLASSMMELLQARRRVFAHAWEFKPDHSI